MDSFAVRRLRWSRLVLPMLVLLLGVSAYGYRWYAPTLPFAGGSDPRIVGEFMYRESRLQPGDRVVELNGQSPEAWQRAGLAALVKFQHEQWYRITVVRDGHTISNIIVPAVRTPPGLALLWWSSAILLGLAALVVATLIGVLGRDSPAEQGVYLAFLGLALYLLCAIPLVGAPPLSWVLEPLLVPLQIVGIGLTSGFLVFFLGYPQPVRFWHPRRLPLAVYGGSMLLATVIFVLTPGDLLRRSAVVSGAIVNGLAGLHALLGIGLGVRAYHRTRDPLVRAQFRWLVWGGIVGLVPWLLLWALPTALATGPVVPFLTLVYLPMPAIPFSFAMAILRYRLLDVDTVLSRTLVYLVLTLGLSLVYIIVTALVSQAIPQMFDFDSSDSFVIFMTTLTLAALFNPALHLARNLVERIFYHERHLLLHEVELLQRELRNVEGWETLLPLLNQEIPHRLGISGAQVLVWADGHFVPPGSGQQYLVNVRAEEEDQPAACIIRLTPPSDWPLDRPLILQNWAYAQRQDRQMGRRTYTRLDDQWSRVLWEAGFHLAFTLIAGGRPVGLYALGRQISGDWYERSSITALDDLTDRIAVAVENARLLEQTATQARFHHELTIARTIQESLLPENYLRHGSFEVAALTLPASDVGGDLYMFEPLSAQSLAAAVGDVSGKGIGAALLMAVTSTMLTTLAGQEDMAPTQHLERLDRLLCHYTAQNYQNVALCYLHLHVNGTQEYQLQAASAGAIPLLLRRADGCLEWLEMQGLPLGTALLTPRYQSVMATLHPGDLLLIVTDGFTEAQDATGTLLGFAGVEQVLAAAPFDQDARAVLHYLMEALRNHTNGSEVADDVTLLVIQCNNPVF